MENENATRATEIKFEGKLYIFPLPILRPSSEKILSELLPM
jgi:hypothetical protein